MGGISSKSAARVFHRLKHDLKHGNHRSNINEHPQQVIRAPTLPTQNGANCRPRGALVREREVPAGSTISLSNAAPRRASGLGTAPCADRRCQCGGRCVIFGRARTFH